MKKMFMNGLFFMLMGTTVLFMGCEETVRVTFDATGGIPEASFVEVKIDTLITEPNPAPAKPGYSFDGCYVKDTETLENPRGSSEGSDRVLRGGSFNFNDNYCRVAYRHTSSPDYSYYYGFRVVRLAPPSQ